MEIETIGLTHALGLKLCLCRTNLSGTRRASRVSTVCRTGQVKKKTKTNLTFGIIIIKLTLLSSDIFSLPQLCDKDVSYCRLEIFIMFTISLIPRYIMPEGTHLNGSAK